MTRAEVVAFYQSAVDRVRSDRSMPLQTVYLDHTESSSVRVVIHDTGIKTVVTELKVTTTIHEAA